MPRRVFLKLEALEARCVPSTVTNLNDDGPGSLRDAIAITPAGGTVDFASGLTGTITLTSAGLAVFKNLTITEPVPASSRSMATAWWRVLDVKPATTVALAGLTLSNEAAGDGGGVRNAGTLDLIGCVIQSNRAFETGGGVHNGTLSFFNSKIDRNSSSETGGGIDNYGFLILNQNALTSNDAADHGGGIYNNGGIVMLNNSTMSGNQLKAKVIGNVYGNVTITGSRLSNNTSGDGRRRRCRADNYARSQ